MVEFVDVDKQKFTAIVERIAVFTVGIAVNDNTSVGTGVLVEDGAKRFVLTAEHVVRDVDPSRMRFWCKPAAPLIEQRASDAPRNELQSLTYGYVFPIRAITTDESADLAVLSLDPEFRLPGASEFYNFSLSAPLTGQSTNLEGVSILCFGFPVANSKEVSRVGQNVYNFTGCACHACYYDSALNSTLWNRISISFSPDANLILRYSESEGWFEPDGFSGCGVWVATEGATDLLWKAVPILVGVEHHYVKRLEILIASRLSSIVNIIARAQ